MSKLAFMLKEHQQVIAELEVLFPVVEEACNRITKSLQGGGKVFFMGNGGSAADSQHLAAELIGRYKLERQAIPAIALSTDTSILTALSNDYDYSIVFSRQLEALCRKEDIVVALSTSGNSKNILEGVKTGKKLGAYTIGLTGRLGGALINEVDLCLCTPSDNVARIQEAHIFIGHMICEEIENTLVSLNGKTKHEEAVSLS